MPLGLQEYLGLCYATVVVPEQCTDGSVAYLAAHPELEGCMAHGDTPEEALQNLAEARLLYISALLERGIHVPTPQASEPTIVWRRFASDHEQAETREAGRAIDTAGVRPLTPLGVPV